MQLSTVQKRLLAAALTLLLAAVGVPLVVTSGEEPSAPPTITPVATPGPVGGPRHGDIHDHLDDPGDIPGPEDAAHTDLGSDLRTETGIPPEDEAANNQLPPAEAPRARPRPINEPFCRKDFGGRVWSSRNGVAPTEMVLHFTVSANRPGWADVLAIESFFSNVRSGSSHYIMDFEGHCLKMVPEREKAWTQGNANPWALSIEIIAVGNETNRQWRQSRLIRRGVLARKMASIMRRHGIPARRVNPAGCVFPRGWTDHDALECGNNHWDVGSKFPFKIVGRQLRRLL